MRTDLKPLADRIAAERAAMNERIRAAFPPAAAEWRAHFAAAAQVRCHPKSRTCLNAAMLYC